MVSLAALSAIALASLPVSSCSTFKSVAYLTVASATSLLDIALTRSIPTITRCCAR